MRIAAGILMIIVGWFSLITGVISLPYLIGFVLAVLAIFSITGGVFCLKRKYWKVCFASALLLFGFSVYFLSAFVTLEPEPGPYPPGALPAPLPWGFILLTVMGIPPLIFICLRKREWAEPDFLRD